jgi:hypothetical protein
MMDLSAINPLLKDEYEDYVVECVHTETVAIDLFQDGDTSSADGRRVILPAHLRRDHAGVGFVGEGAQLPTPAAEGSGFYTIPFRKSAARFQVTKESIDQAQTNRGSFVRTLSYIMDHLVENLTDIRNKAMCHYGADVLGYVNGNPAANATTITVDTPGGVVLPTGVTNATRFFQVGQLLAAIRAGAIVSNFGGIQVAGIAPSGNYANITVAANSGDLADNDILVRAHAASITDVANTSWYQAPMGLLGMIDDGTYVTDYFGLNRGTWDVIKSYVFSSVGALSSDILQQGIDVAYARGRGHITKFLCEQAVRRQLLALREGDVRYSAATHGSDNLDAGSSIGQRGGQLTWSEIPVLVDYNFPYGMLLGIDVDTLVRYNVVPGKFEDWGGSVLVPAAQTHVATGLFYMVDNFFLDAPNKCVRWDGIDVTVNNIHVE